MSNITPKGNFTENLTIQIDLEFLDHVFKIEVDKNIDLEELFEIIEKFIIENPSISIDLKALSKTILDTEYYSLILKQNNTTVNNFDEIQIGIPLRLEMESDDEKKRFITKKRLRSTLRHLDSISINEFVNLFQISNITSFKQNLQKMEDDYPIKLNDDIIHITYPLNNHQLTKMTNDLLNIMN